MTMDKSQAIHAITSVFQRYRRLTPTDQGLLSGLDQGKLYELYVLSELLIDLRRRADSSFGFPGKHSNSNKRQGRSRSRIRTFA